MFCTACGNQILSGETFCTNCGKRLIQTSHEKDTLGTAGMQSSPVWTPPAEVGAVQAGTQVVRTWQKPEPEKPNPDLSPRLISFSGCGTGFCGATGRHGDGSFLTTKWFTLFGVPIIPISSYRVSYGGSSSRFSGVVISESKQYYIYSKENLNFLNVIRTYAILAGAILAAIVLGGLANRTNSAFMLGVAVVIPIALSIWLLRAK